MHRSFMRLLFLLLAFITIYPFASPAQTTYADQMVRDHIDLRRKEEIYKSQRAEENRKKKTANKTVATKPAVRPAEINFAVDMYNPLSAQDAKGLNVVFTFMPAGQNTKAITRSQLFTANNSITVTGIPAGDYTVTAGCKSNQKILLATEIGEPTNPNGGNFSSSQSIRVTMGKDSYGNAALKSFPSLLWIRVQ